MGVRDAIVLNTTGSNFEAIQTNDTVRIKGNNTELLSLRDDSGTAILNVDTTNTSVSVTGNITGSANISGSASTASFGRFDGTLFVGDGNDATLRATLPRSAGTITGSAQMASDISGSHTSGFNYTGTLTGQTSTVGGAWSTSGAMIVGRGMGGFTGTQNAAVYVGGIAYSTAPESWYGDGNKSYTEEYNGATWSEATCFPLPVAPPTSLGPSGPDSGYKVGTGTQNASLFFGGWQQYQAPRSSGSAYTYNGTNFSKVAPMPELVSKHAGSGTQDATISFGGLTTSTSSPYPQSNPNCSHEWNGSSWSSFDPLITARTDIASTPNGTSESTIAIGKGSPSPSEKLSTECWNGSNWSEVADMILPRTRLAGSGTPDDGMTFGGQENAGSPAPATSEIWNGATWSVGGAMTRGNNDIANIRGAGSGPAGLAAGGYLNVTCTEHYDGVTVSTGSFGRVEATSFAGDATNISSSLFLGVNALTSSVQIRNQISGSFTSGFGFSGNLSGSSTSTASFGRIEAGFFEGNANFISTSISIGDNIISQSTQIASDISGSFTSGFEFTGTIAAEKVTVGGVWSTAANMINEYYGGAGAGAAQNAALHFGGRGAPALHAGTPNTEEWNGTSWTEVNNLIDGNRRHAGAGSSESALSMGGFNSPSDKVNYYSGTNWSEVAVLPEPRQEGIGIGKDANALHIGGGAGSSNQNSTSAKTKKYSVAGNAWSEETDAPANLGGYGGAGTSEAAIVARQHDYDSLLYNDGTWSTIASIIDQNKTEKWGMWGTQNDAGLVGASNYGDERRCTQLWNGTSWCEGSAMNLGRGLAAGKVQGSPSSAAAGLAFSTNYNTSLGSPPGYARSCHTELYNGPTVGTGSFGRINASTISGDATNISASIFSGTGVVTSSAQLATDISGSFDKGFEFTGTLGTQTDFSKFAYSFDGSNDFAQIAKGLELNHGKDDPWSVSSWVYFDDTTDWQTLVGDRKASGGYNGWAIYARGGSSWSSSEKIAVNIKKNDSKEIRVRGSSSVPALTWTHIAVTYDGSSNASGIKIYVNGVAETITVIEDALDEWDEVTDNLYVGSRGGSADFFKGDIDELAIFTGSLSANAVSSIYNGGHAFDLTKNKGDYSESADLQVFLRMGESGSDGSIIYDHSENQRSASVSGASIISGTSVMDFSNLLNTTGSFGRIEANTITGDAKSISGSFFTGTSAVTSSVQLASNISGSHISGFDFTGKISGSSNSTGSFGRVDATSLLGDGNDVGAKVFIGTGIVSSSAQLSTSISGSFTSGFALQASPDDFYVGVSGSTYRTFFSGSGNVFTSSLSTSSGSSFCGSDFDYRVTRGQLIGASYGTGVWSNATAMPAAVNGRAMAGTQNAFLSAGGYSAPTQTTAQKFNGTSWTVVASLISSAKASAGVGTQNAMGVFGGYDDYDQSEFYNGASWSNGPNMGTSAAWRGSGGTQNAAIIYGGTHTPSGKKATTELYNGNVFTETADLNTARGLAAAGGTQNDAIYAGGLGSPTGVAFTELWNGTSWSEVTNINTMRWNSTGIGTANHHILVTGHAGGAICSNTEEWNGSSWSEANDLITERAYAGNAAGGLGSQGIYAGGDYSPASCTTTELWNAASTTTGSFGRVVSDKFAGDFKNMSASLYDGIGAISGSAQIATDVSGSFTSGFEYTGMISGSSISTGSFGRIDNICRPEQIFYTGDGSNLDLPVIAGAFSSSRQYDVAGSLTGAHISGAFDTGFEFTGSILDQKSAVHSAGVWSGAAPMVGTYYGGGGAGTSQNAALHFGGRGTPGSVHAGTTNTEEWDGTSWTEQNNLLEGHRCNAGAGSQNSALSMGGADSDDQDVLYYNGTNWAEKADLLVGKKNGIGLGKDANALLIGGGDEPHPSGVNTSTDTQKFSFAGNAWSAETSTPRAVGETGAAGTTEALIIGLYSPSEGSIVYNGSNWSEVASTITNAGGRGMFGTQNDAVIVGAPFGGGDTRCCTETWNGTTWSAGTALTIGRMLNGGKAQGSPSSGASGLAFSTQYMSTTVPGGNGFTELYDAVEFSNSSGSFGLITPKGDVKVESFHITGSTFNLPVFTDVDLNYQAYEAEYSTGSLSGSVDRVADVIVGQEAGEFYFHSDKNALAYTFASSSLISQSLSYGTFTNISASGYYRSSSIGFYTQSFYNETIVTCYITGSQI